MNLLVEILAISLSLVSLYSVIIFILTVVASKGAQSFSEHL